MSTTDEGRVTKTSVTLPFETSVKLNRVKLDMSARAGYMLTQAEVVEELIASWYTHGGQDG